jgi:hypothetical protein
MKKLILVPFVLLLFALPSFAQTTQSITWQYLNTPLATVNTYQQNLKINTGTNNVITPTCVTSGVNTNCSIPVPSPIVLKTGDTVVVTASVNGQSASGSLTVGPGPTQPVTITITITVQ